MFIITTFLIVLCFGVSNIILADAFRRERSYILNRQYHFPDEKVSKLWYWILLTSIFVFNILYGFLFLYSLNVIFA